ncbi:MAG: universal stress protein [Legionella sp.]
MYTKILFATDLTTNHFLLAKQALELADYFTAKLYLLHVIEPPASLQLAQGLGFAEFDHPIKVDAISVIQTLGDALNIPPEHLFVEVGPIKMHVLTKIAELGCDLVIVGSHIPNKIPTFLGSTAHAIADEAGCDVLTLHNKSTD